MAMSEASAAERGREEGEFKKGRKGRDVVELSLSMM